MTLESLTGPKMVYTYSVVFCHLWCFSFILLSMSCSAPLWKARSD